MTGLINDGSYEGTGYYPLASSTSVWVSTRVPAASCPGSEYSAGLWLIPLRHGTKIIPVGQTGTTNCASWNAPDGRRICLQRWSVAARSTALITAGANSTGSA